MSATVTGTTEIDCAVSHTHAAFALVGFEFVPVPDVTERPAQFLDQSHLFERRFQALGGGAHGVDHLASPGLGDESRLFVDGAHSLCSVSNTFLTLA